jgi:hypothetical protein
MAYLQMGWTVIGWFVLLYVATSLGSAPVVRLAKEDADREP